MNASYEIVAFTHRGRVRRANQDAVGIGPTILAADMYVPARFIVSAGTLLSVADGMGGHAAGEVASQFVAQALVDRFDQLGTIEGSRKAMQDSNDRVFAAMENDPRLCGMGSTVVGLMLGSNIHFNVGDSRLYRFRDEKLLQLSEDHVALHIAVDGSLESGSELTQAIGGLDEATPIDPHIAMLGHISAGDQILLCSDGLTRMLSDDILLEVLADSPDQMLAAHELFRRAMAAGGNDNISIILVRLESV